MRGNGVPRACRVEVGAPETAAMVTTRREAVSVCPQAVEEFIDLCGSDPAVVRLAHGSEGFDGVCVNSSKLRVKHVPFVVHPFDRGGGRLFEITPVRLRHDRVTIHAELSIWERSVQPD